MKGLFKLLFIIVIFLNLLVSSCSLISIDATNEDIESSSYVVEEITDPICTPEFEIKIEDEESPQQTTHGECKIPTVEAISNALQRAMNDDLWYWGELSCYTFLVDREFEYEYYIEKHPEYKSNYGEPCFTVSVLSTFPIDNMSGGKYYLMTIHIYNGCFNDKISLFSHSIDRETLLCDLPPEPLGTGSFVLGEVQKPEYDISESEMQETVSKVMNALNSGIQTEYNFDEIYVRYHYSSARETIVLYSYNERTYFAYVALEYIRIFKPMELDVYECGYFIDQFIRISRMVFSL